MAENQLISGLFSLQGKTVLVTGASRGIGQALAVGFAKAGANLFITGRNRASLEGTAALIRAENRSADCIACDQRYVDEIRTSIGDLGPIDVLVNNAGVEDVRQSVDVDEALWDKILDTNLKGAFFVAQTVAKGMLANKNGSIINLASLTSYVGVPTAAAYTSSKSGIAGMTRALSTEWSPQGVRVNAIAPGYFRTELTAAFYENEVWVEAMLAKIPVGRFGALEDLVGSAIYLASDASQYVTGQILCVDGGYLASI